MLKIQSVVKKIATKKITLPVFVGPSKNRAKSLAQTKLANKRAKSRTVTQPFKKPTPIHPVIAGSYKNNLRAKNRRNNKIARATRKAQ